MSSTYAAPIERLGACLDEIGAIDPTYRTTGEKQDALVALARAKSRIAAEELRILATGDDIAIATGARSTAAWLADGTRDNPGTIRRHAALADALEKRWTKTRDALAAGAVNLAQATVMVAALDGVPKERGDDLRVKAEAYLVEQAADLGPREWQVLGRGLLEHLAPDIADAHEYRRLLEAERRADAATRLSMRRRGDGSTDLRARIPDTTADRVPQRLHRPPTPPPHEPDRAGRVREPAAEPAARHRVRRVAGEHPHQLAAPARRHRHHGDGHPRLRHPPPGRDRGRVRDHLHRPDRDR